MKKILYSLLFFLFIPSMGFTQTTVSGFVRDKTTNQPIPGANVFLSGTSIGRQTAEDGSFSFVATVTGSFNLVASFIGYTTEYTSVELKGQPTIEHSFVLKEKVMQFDEVVVTASNKEWTSNFELFSTFMKGSGDYSINSTFVNPEVLDFNWTPDHKHLIASSDAPLIIENQELGYRIETEILEIKFSPNDNNGIFKAHTNFEELTTTSSRQQRKWERNRKKIYAGSPVHFFRSLISNTLKEEGFKIQRSGGDFERVSNPSLLAKYSPNKMGGQNNDYYLFKITQSPAIVGYKLRYDMFGNLENESELSNITYASNNPFFVIDKNGIVFYPAFLNYQGKWGTERYTFLIPANYQPE